MLQKLTFISILVLFSTTLLAQNKQFDKLEMLYNQGHYGLVYRQSVRLLNKPDYDYSMIPSYYKAMATFHIAQNPRMYKKEKYNIDQATTLLLKVKESPSGKEIFDAHLYEIRSLKKDMNSWAEDVRLKGDLEKFKHINATIIKVFGNISDLKDEVIPKETIKEKEIVANKDISQKRQALLDYAKPLLGIPYVYGGTTTSGFDCSGFVGYVLKSQNITVPRRSQDQFTSSKKLKERSVKPGDLVFFGNKNSVTHVGMIYLVDGETIFMIHASSSQGITITDLTHSKYWYSRVQGYGTYID